MAIGSKPLANHPEKIPLDLDRGAGRFAGLERLGDVRSESFAPAAKAPDESAGASRRLRRRGRMRLESQNKTRSALRRRERYEESQAAIEARPKLAHMVNKTLTMFAKCGIPLFSRVKIADSIFGAGE